jgi:hypothetical protein
MSLWESFSSSSSSSSSFIPVAPTLEQTVGHLGGRISPLQGRYLIQTHNKHKNTYTPWVGFEPTILEFEWTKTFYALDRAATVIGCLWDYSALIYQNFTLVTFLDVKVKHFESLKKCFCESGLPLTFITMKNVQVKEERGWGGGGGGMVAAIILKHSERRNNASWRERGREGVTWDMNSYPCPMQPLMSLLSSWVSVFFSDSIASSWECPYVGLWSHCRFWLHSKS